MNTLYVARRIHTLADDDPSATGVLVGDGAVVAVGDAPTLRADATRVVDFGDAAITPGLVDGHSHPVLGLTLTQGVDLTDLLDLDQVRSALVAARDRLAPGEWLRAWALNPVIFGDHEPSPEALAPALDDVPAFLWLYDGHSAIASREALSRAGITGARDFASSARIAVDASGQPTGWLLEAEAAELVERVIPEPSVGEWTEMLDRLLHSMAATGYTGLHAMDFDDPAEQLLTRLEEQGELPLRYAANPMLMPDDDGADAVLRRQRSGGRRWRVEGVKLVVDGTVDGGTAWLEYPDTHGEGITALWRDLDAFREAVGTLHRAGVNCAVHAIGDRGVRQVLEIFAELRQAYGPLARHRIEHIETIPDELVPAFGSDAAAASMQPLHITCFNNADRTDSWSKRLGDIRVAHGFRWQDIRAAGGVVALGSDWPIAPFDPRWIMADARLRRRFDRPDAEAMQPQQALTALQALEGFTTHAALASGEDDTRGRIAPGFDADFTVFADDPLELTAEELGSVDVVGTVVAGELVTP
ncbi:MAG: amidohydrolase family protein [Nocardioidaceae bacterium]